MRKSPARASPRLAGVAMATTVATADLNSTPAPMPATMPATRNTGRLAVRMPTASAATPAAWANRPMFLRILASSRPVSVWATAAAPNTANTISPASARDGWCRVWLTNPGASEVNRPKTAKDAKPAAAAATYPAGSPWSALTRCGRYAGLAGCFLTVSGVSATAAMLISSRAPKTR